MLLRVLLYGLLIYFIYKLIFDLIIPVYLTTKKIKKGFREMHSRMQESTKEQATGQAPQSSPSKPSHNSSDYIDFEEIKYLDSSFPLRSYFSIFAPLVNNSQKDP